LENLLIRGWSCRTYLQKEKGSRVTLDSSRISKGSCAHSTTAETASHTIDDHEIGVMLFLHR